MLVFANKIRTFLTYFVVVVRCVVVRAYSSVTGVIFWAVRLPFYFVAGALVAVVGFFVIALLPFFYLAVLILIAAAIVIICALTYDAAILPQISRFVLALAVFGLLRNFPAQHALLSALLAVLVFLCWEPVWAVFSFVRFARCVPPFATPVFV